MELPRTPPSDQKLGLRPDSMHLIEGHLSHERLREAFARAAHDRQADAERAIEFFSSTMSTLDDIDDDLTWGPRLIRQIRRFVPVVVESGGSLNLAVDHLLYTKLVRRMRDRYTIDDRARRAMLASFRANWPGGAKGFDESKSAHELNRQMVDRS